MHTELQVTPSSVYAVPVVQLVQPRALGGQMEYRPDTLSPEESKPDELCLMSVTVTDSAILVTLLGLEESLEISSSTTHSWKELMVLRLLMN